MLLRDARLIQVMPDDSAKDVQFIASVNASVRQLQSLRAVEIRVAGHLARSKIAWKLAGYQHALLHRVVALFDATSVGLNEKSALGAILAARAVMETVALLVHVSHRTAQMVRDEDLAGLDALAQRGTFATRDKDFLRKHPEYEAATVLKSVDHVEKKVKGFRSHYDALSERCHPNGMGHNFLFSELDHSDGTLRFTGEHNPALNRGHVLAAIGCVAMVEPEVTALDGHVLAVAELQHRINPVPGDGAS